MEAEICTLGGQIAAATSRFLTLLADFDARDGWAGWGVASCAHWLSWRCGLSLHTAHEHVRVARALHELPKVADAFAQGRISYSKARVICRVGTADTEQELLHVALHNPAAHLDRLVRGLRQARRHLDDEDQRRRGGGSGAPDMAKPRMQWRWDDDGTLKIWGTLSAQDGARLLAGLTRMEQQRLRTHDIHDTHRPDDHGGHTEPTGGRAPTDLGPALVAGAELMCTTLDAPIHAPAADVVVHVDADTLIETARQATQPGEAAETAGPTPGEVDGTGHARDTQPLGRVLDPAAGGTGARLDDGPPLPHTVLAMLACDARTQLSVHAADGRTLNLGRRRRRPNRAQLDALWRRDRGCTHPAADAPGTAHPWTCPTPPTSSCTTGPSKPPGPPRRRRRASPAA